MAEKERYISNTLLSEKPVKGIKLAIANGAVKTKHIADEAVDTSKIKNKAVTPAKVSDNFKAEMVFPYTQALDTKFSEAVKELNSEIASLQVGGIALSDRLGTSEVIGIHQKELTELFERVFHELSELNGKTYSGFTLTVVPHFVAKEGPAMFTVTADCSEALCNFDSIRFYVNDILVAESSDIYVYTQELEISESSTIKAIGVIGGRQYVKTQDVEKVVPFFMGSGLVYTDVMVSECAKELDGTLEGHYDVVIRNTGDYMFIIIPITRKNEFRRADMNGYEIPFNRTETEDFVIYQSLNTYQAGTYDVDIDINS